MRLYMMRHGEAESGMDDDSSRALTPRGQSQNRVVAEQWRARLGQTPIGFCSPYLRAQQTAQDMQSQIPGLEFSTVEWLQPSTAVASLLNELSTIVEQGAGKGLAERVGKEAANVAGAGILLVGHNPLLSEAWNLLLEGEGRPRFGLSTSHLVCIDTPVFAPACGSFVYTVTP